MDKFIFNLFKNRLSCIRCGKDIDPLIGFEHPNEEYNDIISTVIDGAVCGKISAPYGSIHDGDVCALGICDGCVDILLEEHRLVYLGDYMGFNNNEFLEKYGPKERN